MTALEQLRAMSTAPPALSAASKAGANFFLLRRCLGESGFGPKVWLSWAEDQLSAPSVNLFDVVSQYQRASGIPDDRVCGRETWSRLAGFKPDAWGTKLAAPAGGGEEALRAAFVRKALSYDGMKELPGNNRNRGPEIDKFIRHCGFNPAGHGAAGVAWCGCFLRYCLDHACAELGVKIPFVISAYVPSIVTQAKTQQRVIPASAVRKGDLWIWKDTSGKAARFRHVDVCTGPVGANGRVPVMGGNTGDGSINAGDGAYAKTRPAAGHLFVNVCRP